MDVAEEFVKACGELSHLTERICGVSVVDAYFGPPELSPERQEASVDGQTLSSRLEEIADRALAEIGDDLRGRYLSGEARSLALLAVWLTDDSLSYQQLVRGLYGIDPRPFDEAFVEQLRDTLAELLKDYPGRDTRERVQNFQREGRVTGEKLRELIEGPLQERVSEIKQLFAERVYTRMGVSVTDNGVRYEAVRGRPWSGYNYYLGDYRSLNQFNIDRTLNRDTMMSVLYHEYEHHVSNLWREYVYRTTGHVELSVVPLHTGRCVISEGTADCARDFLGVKVNDPRAAVTDALYALRRVVSINAALMLNVEGASREEAAGYITEYALREPEEAKASLDFISPTTNSGRANFWAPYVFTYYIGRAEFVLPAWRRAVERDEVRRFFRTLYLNPYSRSSVTWQDAFGWLL